ncbi:MAG: polysaccharide deacetylase family protein [Rubrobacter sp.]
MSRSTNNSACLTFDDGPDPVWTPRILDALDEFDARATFFVITPLARRHPRLIERMREAGHEVALHCERHVRHTELTTDEILTDTRNGLEDLARLGVHPKSWRPPWGVVTEGTKRVSGHHGLDLALWTLDTHDWRGDSWEAMLESIGPELSGGSIVLMHDGLGPGARRDGCAETLILVPALIEACTARGLEPTTFAELRASQRSGKNKERMPLSEAR